MTVLSCSEDWDRADDLTKLAGEVSHDKLISPLFQLGVKSRIVVDSNSKLQHSRTVATPIITTEKEFMNFDGNEVYFHAVGTAVVITTNYETVRYQLTMDLNKESFSYSDGNSTYSEVSQINSQKEKLILSYLVANYLDITDANATKMTFNEYRKRHEKLRTNGVAAADGCKLVTGAASVTRGDAAAEASSTPPAVDCVKSGEPGCVCATGIWGGDLICLCLQVWNCDDPVTCLNVN